MFHSVLRRRQSKEHNPVVSDKSGQIVNAQKVVLSQVNNVQSMFIEFGWSTEDW